MKHTSALSVNHVSYAFGKKKALDNVSFNVERAACTILLGPNGAGKSTLFSLVTRLYDASSGEIYINGLNLKRDTRKAIAKLGVVFQQSTLDMDLSVLQNLRYHAALHGMSRKLTQQRIQQELERQGMYDRRTEQVRSLNGGHRRRVEIARALLHQPSVLLLDEPTVGLDVPSRKAIVDYLHALATEQNISIFWASHLIDEIASQDRLIVLDKGQIKASGTVSDVIQTAQSETISDAFEQLTQKAASI